MSHCVASPKPVKSKQINLGTSVLVLKAYNTPHFPSPQNVLIVPRNLHTSRELCFFSASIAGIILGFEFGLVAGLY